MTKLSIPAAIVLLASSASSTSSSVVPSQPKRLRKTDVRHRSAPAGGAVDGRQPRKSGDGGGGRRLQFPVVPDGIIMSSCISMVDLSVPIDLPGELGLGPVIDVVPTMAPVDSAAVTFVPVLDAEMESISMSIPPIEIETSSPTPAVTEAFTTLPPVVGTMPPALGTMPPVLLPTPPPVVAPTTPPVAPTHPPIHNIFDTPTTPAPTTIAMSMPEEDMSLSLPGIGEDADVGGGSPPPTPFVTADSTPTVGTAATYPPFATPSPVQTPAPFQGLLPAGAEGSRYVPLCHVCSRGGGLPAYPPSRDDDDCRSSSAGSSYLARRIPSLSCRTSPSNPPPPFFFFSSFSPHNSK